MARFIILVTLVLGFSLPSLWHFYLLDIWVDSVPVAEREFGYTMGVMYGYIGTLSASCVCGFTGVVFSLINFKNALFYKISLFPCVFLFSTPITILLMV